MKTIVYLMAGLLVLACSKEKVTADLGSNNNDYIGYWVSPAYNDSTMTLKKADALKDNDYGFGFLSNGVFIERKNAGWCGTPPIAYTNDTGTWAHKGTIVEINVPYWGGTAKYLWKLANTAPNEITVTRLKTEYSALPR